MQNYSYKLTIKKAVKYGLTFLVASLPFAFALIPPETKEMSLLDLVGYIAPILKTITLGAILVLIQNWAKWNLTTNK